MKKIFSILIIVVLVLCLVGCESETTKTTIKQESTSNIHIWTDEETGVQYIVYYEKAGDSGMGGITPRLNADGTLYISTEKGGAE